MKVTIKSASNMEQLQKNLKELQNTTELSFAVLFNDAFMEKHTEFSSLTEMLKKSGFKIESKEDFKAVPDEEWEIFVQSKTNFESWLEMQKAAHREYASSMLTSSFKKL